ncbi:MAG: hypothetical protein GF335_04195 [Candidatus Moranbacteria bacterium]|nr:hypothetical protein [Candidatus Moranbacteria bacterium]
MKPTQKIKNSFVKSLKNIKNTFPILLGILLLISLIQPLFEGLYLKLFSQNELYDTFLGAIAGSISFGMPITSYIVGGELLKNAIGLLAVTSFIMAWTTVGIAMLPLEISSLGKKFAISRNIVNFVFAIFIAFLTVYTLKLL